MVGSNTKDMERPQRSKGTAATNSCRLCQSIIETDSVTSIKHPGRFSGHKSQDRMYGSSSKPQNERMVTMWQSGSTVIRAELDDSNLGGGAGEILNLILYGLYRDGSNRSSRSTGGRNRERVPMIQQHRRCIDTHAQGLWAVKYSAVLYLGIFHVTYFSSLPESAAWGCSRSPQYSFNTESAISLLQVSTPGTS